MCRGALQSQSSSHSPGTAEPSRFLLTGNTRRVLSLTAPMSWTSRQAARRFLAKALRSRQDWPPHVINTDKNPAYGEALRQLKRNDPNVGIIGHRQAKYPN